METQTSEITQEVLNDFIKNIPEDAVSGELIALTVSFLKKNDHVFVHADTIKQLLTDPPPDVIGILGNIDKITKNGDIIKVVMPQELTYGKGMKRVSVAINNIFTIKKMNYDQILMDMSGVTSGLLTLGKIKIHPEGVDVYTGRVLGWTNVLKF